MKHNNQVEKTDANSLKSADSSVLAVVQSPAGCGKTSFALSWAAELCRNGYNGLFYDADYAIMSSIITGTGLSDYCHNGNFLPISANYIDLILNNVEKNINFADFIIIDSLSSVTLRCFHSYSIEESITLWPLYNKFKINFMKKLKKFAVDHNKTIIVTSRERVPYLLKDGERRFTPKSWLASLADTCIEIKPESNIITSAGGIIGYNNQARIFCRKRRGYELSVVPFEQFFGCPSNIDFKKYRFRNFNPRFPMKASA